MTPGLVRTGEMKVSNEHSGQEFYFVGHHQVLGKTHFQGLSLKCFRKKVLLLSVPFLFCHLQVLIVCLHTRHQYLNFKGNK